MPDSRTSTALLDPSEPPAVAVEPAPRSDPPRRTPPGAAVLARAERLNQALAPVLLRLALAAVFVWFGALKLAGASPVEELVAATLPFVDPGLSLPLLGGVEVLLGLVLASGVLPRLTSLVLAGHLAGTFLSFVTASELMWRDGNPLALTADGEFVVKNVVLISAVLVLLALRGGSGRRG